MRSLACLLWTLTFATGCVLEDQPVGGGDGGTDVCGSCPADKPACNEEVPACVQCTGDNASACVDDTPVCDTGIFECVECVTSAECDEATAARCDTDTNRCAGCENATDCDGIAGLSACSNGTCVQCTSDANCAGKSCNTNTLECTDTDVGSLETCEQCVADSECMESNRCVPMDYQGVRHPNGTSGFCLKSIALGGSCDNPYRIVIREESLSGAPEDDYCGINQSLATCEAVRALLLDEPCNPANGNDDCPQPSGLCKELPGMRDTCTYLCGAPVECLSTPAPGSTCGSSGSGGDDYCGG